MSTTQKATEVVSANVIESIMATLGAPSLKAFAAVFGLNPIRLYSVAKQPKEGQVYDAKVFNWDAVERFVTRRLDAEKGLATLEDVVNKALEFDAEFKNQDGRKAGNRGEGGSYGKTIEVDGKQVPARRFANFEIENGQMVCLKKDPEVYGIVLQTASHTVLRALASALVTDAAPDFKGNEVKVISNGMLNFKGMGPSTLEKAVADRFSGEYAKKLAQEAQKFADLAAAAVPAAE